jgi:hypothetical protein
MTTLMSAPGIRSHDPGPTAVELLQREASVRRLHPAQDVLDRVLWYGRPVEGGLVMVNSERQALRADELPAGIALRHDDPGPSTVSRDVAVQWVTGGDRGSLAQTLDALGAFFTRYVILPDARTALWVSAWTLATWCYRGFRVFPYLSIRSSEKRCGKSRLLGLLARVTFNASPVPAHPTEPQLFRTAARTAGVQLFDEVESLRGQGERFDALVTVLNVGFERGGVVTRLERRGERLVEEPYEVFAPRVLAGIAGLKDTLEDRSLPIFMIRKRRAEPVARLGRATDEEAQGLRDRCALACLTHIAAILGACETASANLEEQGIDDRAVDLWSPLVAVALAADAEDGGDRAKEMLAAAKDLASVRDADSEAGPTVKVLETLEAIRREKGKSLSSVELLEATEGKPGFEGVKHLRRLASLLNPLGIGRRQVRDGSARRWYYVLDAERLAELRARYGG